MTRLIEKLSEISQRYDAIVLDQWGVLHDGSAPYPETIKSLKNLRSHGQRLAVLSNSGKRASVNAKRIVEMGFDAAMFDCVMTSGEALYQDIQKAHIAHRRFFPIERAEGDAVAWAKGLTLEVVARLENAQAILLMGLPDGSTLVDWQPILDEAAGRNLPVYCSNPDKKSPRAEGLVISPGTLAFAYKDKGKPVTFYGKPHRPIFDALQATLGTKRLLMVGDSLEHDIAGAQGAGWDSLLVAGGLYANEFASGDQTATLAQLVSKAECAPPTFMIETLR